MSDDAHREGLSRPIGRCPICNRPSDPELKPFCSKRCADVDLHRWLGGHYRVPTEDEPEDGDKVTTAPRSED